MAFESNFVTMIGNLTDDPDLRFTGGGSPVCNLRIASNRRWTGRDGQQQEETTFMSVVAWGELGENVAQSLRKGDRAIVIGRIQVRSFEGQDGQTRWVTEVNADEVAPSLRWAVARPDKSRGGASAPAAGRDEVGGPAPAPDMDDVPF